MKLHPSWLRRIMLIAMLLGLVALCGIGIVVSIVYYPELGRISDFQPMIQGDHLPGTNYTIENVGKDIALKNSLSQQSTNIAYIDNPYSAHPKYKLLNYHNKLYLITLKESGGSSGAFVFGIYDISTDQPRNLMANISDLSTGFSCTYPRLDGDSLEFEIAEHCDFFPLVSTPIRSYKIQLN